MYLCFPVGPTTRSHTAYSGSPNCPSLRFYVLCQHRVNRNCEEKLVSEIDDDYKSQKRGMTNNVSLEG